MIKIFRSIRQKMLVEKKFSNYLIYAIGEIILVVIGILIALQINTANQNRQREKLEKVLLKQVKSELINIYGDIWSDSERLKLAAKSNLEIQKIIAQDVPYSDSMCFDFHWIKMDEYIYPISAAYSKLKEEGLDIIQNDSIRFYLQILYEGQFPRLMKNNSFTPDISETLNEYYLNAFKPNTDLSLKFNAQLANDTLGGVFFTNQAYNYPDLDDNTTVGYVPLDFERLKKDTKFHMLLDQTKQYRDYKLRRYSYTVMGIKEVIIVIDRELGADAQ